MPELGGELGDAEIRAILVEGGEDRERLVGRLHRCVFCNALRLCATWLASARDRGRRHRRLAAMAAAFTARGLVKRYGP